MNHKLFFILFSSSLLTNQAFAISPDSPTRNYNPQYDKNKANLDSHEVPVNHVILPPNNFQVNQASRNYNPNFDLPLKRKIENENKAKNAQIEAQNQARLQQMRQQNIQNSGNSVTQQDMINKDKQLTEQALMESQLTKPPQ